MTEKKKSYERPHMEVVELKSRQTLLTGSIQSMEEEVLWEEE